MSEHRRALIVVSLVLASACTPPGPRVSSQGAAIVGGSETTGDPAVFLLAIRSDTGIDSMCSATLIGARTLITAAHCVDPSMIGGTSLALSASNAPTRAQMLDGGASWAVVETRLHPSWNPAAGLANDLALLLLEVDAGVAPLPWSRASISDLGGEPVRAVGYGASAPDAGMGTKRTVDLSIRQLSAGLITLGDLVDKGICHGDSGGPTFHVFPDGVERLIGVHSFTRSDTCVDGADTRLDVNAAFLLQWFSDREDTCGADGVCSLSACASPDLDCVALGERCTSAFECAGRRCLGDAQHPEPYCTRPCTQDAECGAALACDGTRCQKPQLPTAATGEPCREGTTLCVSGDACVVTADDPQPRCRQACSPTRECLPGHQCTTTPGGDTVCLPPPPLQIPIARFEGPAAGCSQVPLAPFVALVALWLTRVRAAQRPRNC